MLADDHDITIKSNSHSTEESDDSYMKITDGIEVLTDKKMCPQRRNPLWHHPRVVVTHLEKIGAYP